jgi:hypothetical protein
MFTESLQTYDMYKNPDYASLEFFTKRVDNVLENMHKIDALATTRQDEMTTTLK